MKNILKKLRNTENLGEIKKLVSDYIMLYREEDAKRFYKNDYHIQHSKTFMNCMLYGFIAAQRPKSIFEFGANCGRHLRRLKDYLGVETFGIDINPGAVEAAIEVYELDVKLADETYLPQVKQYDIALTNSVLCHIKNIDEIVKQLKRIGKMVVIVETNSKDEKFYFKHDYLALGFTQVLAEFSPVNNCLYKLYYHKEDVI